MPSVSVSKFYNAGIVSDLSVRYSSVKAAL